MFRQLALTSFLLISAPVAFAARDVGTAARAAEITGRKVALVVGNGRYRDTSPLAQAPMDAEAVAAELRRLGFEVVEVTDADRAALSLAVIRFEKALKGADVGFFYYAGHAVQVGGANYLVPVDAKLTGRDYVDVDAMDARKVLVAMQAGGSRLNIAVFDSCRNNVGAAVAGAGDVDGDGTDDFVVSAPLADYSTGGTDCGGVYLFLGGDYSGTTSILDATVAWVGEAAGDQLGMTIGGGGDFDRDGHIDYFASSSENGLGAGALYVFPGGSL